MTAEDAYHRQRLRLAIDAAGAWGFIRPRRWLSKYGGYDSSKGEGAREINNTYKEALEAINSLCKPVQEQD